MLDINQRQALMESLKQRSKKASSSVSTKVEAEKGDFSVVITSDTIDHFYKGASVGKIRVAELDDPTIELINSDAQEAAHEMLDAFATNFDKDAFDKSASQSKEAAQDKTAAHETLDSHTWQMTTQKQLDDQKPSLHPRTDDYPRNITQKQIPEDGQRPGTYEEITEAQFTDETSTFYNEPLDGGKRILEDRNIVTEGQFEDGVADYSDHGQSERGEVGSKFDGDLAKQQKMIGEKQLAELLKHHEWTEPLTITEGKDQLAQQDGELSRLTAAVAEKIIREALDAMGKTVLAAGVTPQNLISIVQRLTSHPSKFPVLSDTLRRYAQHDVNAINEKVAKARYFGKVANANADWSNELIADVLVRQLAKLSYNSDFIVDGLVALANNEECISKIDEAANNILENKEAKTEQADNISVFSQVLSEEHDKPALEGSAEEDGMYEYTGTVDEVKVPTANKDEFIQAAAEYARGVIKASVENDSLNLEPMTIDVNEDVGTFKIQMKDASFKEESIEARAEARRKMAKEAQFGGGGGAPPAAGPEMGNPMAPPGGADMGAAPPGEAFSQEPPMEDEMGGPEMAGGEPKPPGAICPVDGSEDVDVDNGEFRCNSCGAEGTIHVRLDVNKWPETIQETGEEADAGFGLGAEEDQGLEGGLGGDELAPGGEGDGTTMPNVPIAASVRVTPLLLEKIAKQNIDLGGVCPNCGGHNTDLSKSSAVKGQHGICFDCLQEYNFQVKANRKKAHNVFAQYIWTPKIADKCDSCSRLRSSFVKSLGDYGMRVEDFEKLSMKEKGDAILKMSSAGTLNLSLDTPLPMDKYAASFKQKFEKFPSASCREKIARKWGENATAMSGPCQGKALADCVCGQLEDLGIYTDGLAAKVAHVQSSDDPIVNNPSETCVRMFMNDNRSIKEACTICDGLRASAASDEELMIEAIAQMNPFAKPKPAPKPMAAPTDGMAAPNPMKPQDTGAKPMAAPGAPAPTPAPMDAKPMAGDPMATDPNMGGLGADPMGADPMGGPDPMAPKPMAAPGMGAPDPMAAAPMESPAGDFMGDPQMGAPGMDPGMGAPGTPGMGDPGMGAKPMANPMDMSMSPGAQPMAQPMDSGMPSPMDEPVMDGEMPVDDAGDGHLDIEMGGDFDDTGLGDEMGGDGDLVTILVDGLQSIIDALSGGIGDDMIDMTGDELGGELGGEDTGFGEEGDDLDMGEVTDDVVDDGGEEGGDEIPGVMNESDEGDEDLEKSGDPEEEMSLPMKSKEMKEKPMAEEKAMEAPTQKVVVEAKPMSADKATLPVAANSEEDAGLPKEASTDVLDKTLYRMKRGTITKSNDALDSLFDGLVAGNSDFIKEAAKSDGGEKKVSYKEAKESKLTDTPVQDAKDIGKVKDNKTMGHEEPLGLSGPDVPRGAATIGDEGSEVTVNDSDRPSVPHGAPLMDGEEHFTPEKGNVVDGNQGGGPMTSASESEEPVKTAETKEAGCCKGCKKPMAKCKCMEASSEEEVKTASCGCPETCACGGAGTCDGSCGCKTANNNTQKKESQTVSPKSVDKLEDDPDINQSSGPGQGKTHADEAHSLGVDEKKPSDGMSEPEVPEAPEGGQLAREHTYDNALEGPEIPAGGGMNPDYDENEKNTPEKLDQTLGKHNDIAAMAEMNRERATKIAGQMLKAQQITIDELPDKINELAKVSSNVLDDYESMMKQASQKKGLQKAATAGSTETSFQLQTHATDDQATDVPLKDQVQSLFKLDQRNKDFESYSGGNPRLWH